MRNKRLLTLLLSLCMILSALAPAAHAVHVGEDSFIAPVQTQEVGTSGTVEAPKGALNLRDNPIEKPEEEKTEETESEGIWTATPVEDAPFDSPALTQTPDCIEELRAAAEVLDADEMVAAFVVMEDAPLAETYDSITRISDLEQEQMLQVQNLMIEQIENEVLNNSELEVRYQFTYLTNAFSIETEFSNLEKIAMMDGVKSVFVMPVYHPLRLPRVCSLPPPPPAARWWAFPPSGRIWATPVPA